MLHPSLVLQTEGVKTRTFNFFTAIDFNNDTEWQIAEEVVFYPLGEEKN